MMAMIMLMRMIKKAAELFVSSTFCLNLLAVQRHAGSNCGEDGDDDDDAADDDDDDDDADGDDDVDDLTAILVQ